MARKTIKIEIPIGSPDDMITLAEGIVAHNTELGAGAKLDSDEVTELKDKAALAKAKRKKSAELKAQAATLDDEAAALIGIAPGQDAQTEDTVLYRVVGFRDELLTEHRGNEQTLGEYGFKISIGTAKTPGPRKKKP